MLQISQCRVKIDYTDETVKNKVSRILHISPQDIIQLHICKESLDARKKPQLYYSLVVHVTVKDEKKVFARCRSNDVRSVMEVSYRFPASGNRKLHKRPIIVGAGPAGLVCAYYLARGGYRPLVLERGKCVEQRQKDIESFWETGKLLTNSNVQFGEGGAGTFSDGKLNTLLKDKDGKCREIMKLFVKMGAPSDILYKQKPHVGTDLLMKMVKNLRLSIEKMGGEIRFESQVTDLDIQDGKLQAVLVNGTERLETQQLVLAIGHSARDTFRCLYERGITIEPKSFAVGYRVQHFQHKIDESQYGKQESTVTEKLGAASYKLTAQTSRGRGVYSFCMCPGGYVVNASSEEGRCAINGMSYHARDSKVANSAIIVSVSPKDFRDKTPLGGVEFQRELEERCYRLLNGAIPIQRLADFKADQTGKPCDALPICIKGQYGFANLRGILPTELEEAFLEGMECFGHKIKGYDEDDTILAGIESRTSSPVRIPRDAAAQSSVRGIYPCGEGAGYAGGITSAAMDGLYVAEQLASSYTPFPMENRN